MSHAPAVPAQPFSRLADVRGLPAVGSPAHIVADATERERLARLWDAPSVESVEGEFRLVPGKRGEVAVRGVARARLTRTCVATLEDFPVEVEEEVDVVFAPEPDKRPARAAVTPGRARREREEVDLAALAAVDPPDPIVDGRIDLGALTAEFVALGLDPYPRRPGAVFHGGDQDVDGADVDGGRTSDKKAGEEASSPMAALSGLKPGAGRG